jgi:hypothetical protein
MFQGRSGLPYFRRVSLVHTVYRSSESIKRPSMSKRHALIAGGLGLVSARGWPAMDCRDDGHTGSLLVTL